MSRPKSPPKKEAPKTDDKSAKKCRALEVGHRSCDCGGPHCGEQIHEP